MRAYMTLLLTAAVVTDIANAFGFEGMEATLANTNRSGVVDYDRVRDDRQSWEHGSKNGEERMLGDELAKTALLKLHGKFLRDIKTKLLAYRSEDTLTETGRTLLELFDTHVAEQSVAKLSSADMLKYCDLDRETAVENMITDFSNHKDGMEHVLKAMLYIRDTTKKGASKRRTAGKNGRFAKRKRKPKVNFEVQRKMLDNFIKRYTENEAEALQELDDVLIVFDGWAKFSTALSIASKSQLIGNGAMQLRDAVIKNWLTSEKTVDQVYDMLEVSELGEDGLTYENLDTFIQFVKLHNKEVAGSQTSWPAYLRKKLGKDIFAAMLSKGVEKSQYAKEIETKLKELWKEKGNPTTCCINQLGDADAGWEDLLEITEHHPIAVGEENSKPDKLSENLDEELDLILYGSKS
ncbi:unnamed protein product [Hyaloperonospora brassicae]|uniref:RxLR effector candidate protein n=1 Tax=Hyaloperonospora brassicae TaxID=162125 RepID=A0AAV0V0Z3_HYABA|nr:unnamed protein product [Hyaloperonospora brassicae]